MEIKLCEKKEGCSHFLIERLIKELGGLGINDLKIKSKEEFKNWEKKIEKLGQEVKKFESSVVEFFDAKGFYPCADLMQITWGRRKYQACLKDLEKKAYLKTKMEVMKR